MSGSGSNINKPLCVNKGQEPFLEGRLCLTSFEHSNFWLASYHKYKTKALLSSRVLFLVHAGCQNFDDYTLFLLCHNDRHLEHRLCQHLLPKPIIVVQGKLAGFAKYDWSIWNSILHFWITSLIPRPYQPQRGSGRRVW